MAEEAAKPTTTQEEQQVLVTDKTDTNVPSEKEDNLADTETELEKSKPKPNGDDDKIPESGSFKEESTIVSDLPETEKKALQELKNLIQEALNKHEFSAPVSTPKDEKIEPLASDVDGYNKKEPVAVELPPETEKPRKKEEEGEGEEAVLEEVKEEKVDDSASSVDLDAEKTVEETVVAVSETEQAKVEEAEQPAKKEEGEASEGKVADSAPSADEDGAKTVEAIEETVVAVSATCSETEQAKLKEAEQEQSTKEEASSLPLPPEEVSIWGVPLLVDERSNVILLKFLRARDFKVKEAFAMIKNTIQWRKEFKIEELLEEDFGDELEKAVYMHGFDKEGHPVCYNIYGEFQNKELYKKTFSDEEKRQKFLRWRIQFLEKSIRKLDFSPGGISTIVQVNDLKNSPGLAKWELRQATKQALQLLQDNYPEFVAKQVFINVPWWYLAVNRMISPFLTQRTKSKFVFAGPSKSAETLLRYIAPEQLPVKYGGLSKDGEFGISDAVTEITVKPAAKHTVEFPVNENCLLSWELRVIGWDINYSAEFVPSSEGSYTVIIQKARKIASSEEPVLSNNYKIGEPGKVVLTIDNPSSKKKKLLYRLKAKPSN